MQVDIQGEQLSDRQKYDFKRALEEIRTLKGRGTELISVYVPPNKQISDVAAYLREEFSQSSNIKSQGTRKNVQGAIQSILARLKYFKAPPANGVIFFVGEIAAGGDQTRMVQYVLEPPEPIGTFLYRCDSDFYLDPLSDMLLDKKVYGLIEISANEFYKKAADIATESFLNLDGLQGILIGGPGPTKDYFASEGYLHHELQKKVVDTFDIGYTDEYGLKELVEKAKDRLLDMDLMREKRLILKLLEEIRKNEGSLATYGEDQVRAAIKIGAVEVLLLSEGLRKRRITIECASCGTVSEMTVTDVPNVVQCPKCGANASVAKNMDIVDDLFEQAESMGTKIELISSDSEEGDMLLKAFGGIAALLRYSTG